MNKVTFPFEYPIVQCDDAMESLGDGAGRLYVIAFDCAQVYHQILVWYKDQDKLAFFAPDEKNTHFHSNAVWAIKCPSVLYCNDTMITS